MHLVGNTYVPDSDHMFDPVFRRVEVFEPAVFACGLRHVEKWRTAIDGGAHVGSWSRALAARFKQVIGFEPQPQNYECAQQNTERLPNVLVLPYALADHTSRRGLKNISHSACWHLAEGEDCTAIALDRLGLADVDYLKLDVEGAEGAALLGAQQTIWECRPVIQIEVKVFNDHARIGPDPLMLLCQWGYREVDRCHNDRVFTCG